MDRAGQEYGPVDAVVRSDMMYRFSREQAVDDLQALVQPLGQDPRIGRLAERAVLGVNWGAQSDAEDRSTAREPVQRRYLSRKLPRPAPRHRRDRSPDPDPGRGIRNRAQRNPRVDDGKPQLAGTKNVIPQQESVPSLTFCRHRKLDEYIRLGERRRVDCVAQRHPHSVPGRDQLPNHRCRRVAANSCFSAARSAEGPRNGAVGAGPDKKSASTLPTKPPPNSM
jgi:hypothetical protein